MSRYRVIDRYNSAENVWEYDKIEGGCEYSLNNLHRNRDINNELNGDAWVDMEHCGGSDYSGCSVTAANYKVMREDFGDHPDVAFYYGDYGSYGVIYRENTTDEELKDIINGLADYPLISEDEHSHLELQWENEAWDNWARHDYTKALIKEFTKDLDVEEEADLIETIENKIDDISSDDLREIFETARERANVYWESENSGMYVDIDRVVKETTAEDLKIDNILEVSTEV